MSLFEIRIVSFIGGGVAFAAIETLDDFTQVQLLMVVFVCGGLYGLVGALIRKGESKAEAVIIGSSLGLLAMLAGERFEPSWGRTFVVAAALLAAATGKEVYSNAADWVRKKLGIETDEDGGGNGPE